MRILQAEGISESTAIGLLDQAVINAGIEQPAGSCWVRWDHVAGFSITAARHVTTAAAPGLSRRPVQARYSQPTEGAIIRGYLQRLAAHFNALQGENWDCADVVARLTSELEGLGGDINIGLE